VALTSRCVDVAGNEWRAEAMFAAGADGIVDLRRDAPTAGDWSGADPMAFVTALRFASADAVPEIFIPSLDALAYSIEARVGATTLTTLHARSGAAPGVRQTAVATDRVLGNLFLPAGTPPSGGWPGVVLFSGSEGGVDSQAWPAALLASHGYAALVAGYFGAPGLPTELARIPLERFADSVSWLAEHHSVNTEQVHGMAISRGAEGLLACAAYCSGVPLAGLVLLSPSSHVFPGLGESGSMPHTSAWTLAGQELPFVPTADAELLPEMVQNALHAKKRGRAHQPSLLHLRRSYAAGLSGADDATREAARLPAERVAAPILTVAGEDDQVWPSVDMARAIAAARGHGHDERDDHVSYPACGHLIRFPYLPTDVAWTSGIALGGNAAGQAAAQSAARERILSFLHDNC
jgi:dienelactone hydrolase